MPLHSADIMFGPLLTDLYQLTMLQAYHDAGMEAPATFEFFARKLPPGRNFLLAAGLEQVLAFLEGLQFAPAQIQRLADTGRFTPAFLDSLAQLRFTGEVWAMPEGTTCFADEPLLRVTAPIAQAQLVESRVINLMHYETLVASKAARCVLAAPGRLLVDFGLRRAHAGEAGLLSARASYLAGFGGTATVEAGLAFGIPLFGTMAHSFVQAFDNEVDAFEHFARSQPANAALLIDTYDTEAAARKVVQVARTLACDGIRVGAVRLDSGDLAMHARNVRAILDEGGLPGVQIFASGNLDEQRLRALVRSGAPIDGFGVGTRMNTSADAPFLDCAYKLTEYDGVPRRKRSEGKATWPGRKQVLRRFDSSGTAAGDVLALQGERIDGVPLLQQVMADGKRVVPSPTLQASRELARQQLAALPEALRELEQAPPYQVAVSAALTELARQVDARLQAQSGHAAPVEAFPEPVTIGPGDALLLVDIQRDFLPGGALAVADSEKIIPTVNEWLERFAREHLPVVASRDWHPPAHCSFKPNGSWPVHCVANTHGAALSDALQLPGDVVLVDKGAQPDRDAYSAFAGTRLEQLLRERGVRRLLVAGLATDYCVLHTVEDARGLGFEVVLLIDAVRAVNVHPSDGQAAIDRMRALGARVAGGRPASIWEAPRGRETTAHQARH